MATTFFVRGLQVNRGDSLCPDVIQSVNICVSGVKGGCGSDLRGVVSGRLYFSGGGKGDGIALSGCNGGWWGCGRVKIKFVRGSWWKIHL